MELQLFVTNTLLAIVRGVESAAEQLKESQSIVSPGEMSLITGVKGVAGVYGSKIRDVEKYVHLVKFDVAVTASEAAKTSGEFGIKIIPVKLGLEGTSDSQSGHESRIKFSVPILLPAGDKAST
jgi:hypothetical protein